MVFFGLSPTQPLTLFNASMEEEIAPGKDDPPSFTFTSYIGCYAPGTAQFFRWVARSCPCLQGIAINRIDRTVFETLNLVAKSCSATLTAIMLSLWEERTFI